MGVLCLSLFCYALLCVHFSFENILRRKKLGCFAFIALQMYCYYKCSVAFPHGAMGWSAVCDCDIKLFVRPIGVYLLDFFCSRNYFYLLLIPYLSFISFSYLDLYFLGDDALIS